MNNKELGVNEVYGDGMGKSGNGQEQSDVMQRARNYGGRFGQPAQIDQAKERERQAEVDRVRG